MNTKLSYTAPECEILLCQQAVPLCQSNIPDLSLDPLQDDPDAIEWL